MTKDKILIFKVMIISYYQMQYKNRNLILIAMKKKKALKKYL